MSTRIYCLNNQFTPRDDISILFQGNKPLIKPRVNLDLIIALHCEQDCVEIIAYHPIFGKEAPRLYYTVPSLLTKMDQVEIANMVATQKESSMRRRGSMNIAKYTHKIILECLKKFIFHRIDVSYECQSNQQEFSIYLRKLSKDVEASGNLSNKINLASLKPDDVVPLETNFLGRVRDSEEIKDFLNALDNQSNELKKATNLAEKIVTLSAEEFQSALEEKRLLRLKENNDRKAFFVIRWKRAIQKVLFNITLEKVKVKLLSPSEKYKQMAILDANIPVVTPNCSVDEASVIINSKKPLILPSILKVNTSMNAKSYRASPSSPLHISPSSSSPITPRIYSPRVNSPNANSMRNSNHSLSKSKNKPDSNSSARNKSARNNKKANKIEDENSLVSANSILESTHKLLDSLLEMTSHLVYTKKK